MCPREDMRRHRRRGRSNRLRSEEHTSELQSQSNIVCRLLLEKKINTVLVLLIIFMVTAPVIQSGIQVNVPKSQVVREIAAENLLLPIAKEQQPYLHNDPVNVN